jgi:hypothetical protein
VHEPRDHLAERSHLFRLHELRLRGLQPHVGSFEFGRTVSETAFDRAQDVEHERGADVTAILDEDEVVGDRTADVSSDRARRIADAGFNGKHEWRAVHEHRNRTTAEQLAPVRLQEHAHEFVAADHADRSAVGGDDRQAQQARVIRVEEQLRNVDDAGIGRHRRRRQTQRGKFNRCVVALRRRLCRPGEIRGQRGMAAQPSWNDIDHPRTMRARRAG